MPNQTTNEMSCRVEEPLLYNGVLYKNGDTVVLTASDIARLPANVVTPLAPVSQSQPTTNMAALTTTQVTALTTDTVQAFSSTIAPAMTTTAVASLGTTAQIAIASTEVTSLASIQISALGASQAAAVSSANTPQ